MKQHTSSTVVASESNKKMGEKREVKSAINNLIGPLLLPLWAIQHRCMKTNKAAEKWKCASAHTHTATKHQRLGVCVCCCCKTKLLEEWQYRKCSFRQQGHARTCTLHVFHYYYCCWQCDAANAKKIITCRKNQCCSKKLAANTRTHPHTNGKQVEQLERERARARAVTQQNPIIENRI